MINDRIIRVFPRKTSMTPTGGLSFVGEPPESVPPGFESAAVIHVSCVFTWDKPEAERLRGLWAQFGLPVHLGGPAYKTPTRGFTPGMYVKEGVTFTSRGCPRRCFWCVVPEIEGGLVELEINPGQIVQDNNLLACSNSHVARVFDMLETQRRIVFSGGLDARYLQSWHVKRLGKLGSRIMEMWFAADTPHWAALGRVSKLLRVQVVDWWKVPSFAGVDAGLGNRVDRVRATGNGQVPAVAALAWRVLSCDINENEGEDHGG